jgi:uncharacterized protein
MTVRGHGKEIGRRNLARRAAWRKMPRQMNWLFLTLALAAAGFVQGLSGFGFGLVSMSLMPLFMSIKQAAVISTVFTLLATVVTYARHYRDYQWRLGALFLASVCVGLPAGVYLLQRSSEELLMRLMGGFMLAYVTREFLLPPNSRPIPRLLAIPWGLFSGAVSGAFNLGGVPSAAYAYAQPWSRNQIMAFLQVMISLSCLLRIVFYHGAGLGGRLPWTTALLLAIPVYLTLWLGHLALNRVKSETMRNGIFAFVGLSGVYYLFLQHAVK